MIPKSGNKNIDLAITIGVIIVIIFILQYISKLFKVIGDPQQAILDATHTNPDTNLPNPTEYQVDESKLNYPKECYKMSANTLYDSIWGFFADRQAIRDIMYNVNSDDDLIQLSKEYGIQTSLFGIIGGSGALAGHLREVMPIEDINGFNYHYAGWGMKLRI